MPLRSLFWLAACSGYRSGKNSLQHFSTLVGVGAVGMHSGGTVVVHRSSCVVAREGYIVEIRMTADLSRFSFTVRYWRTIAGSAD